MVYGYIEWVKGTGRCTNEGRRTNGMRQYISIDADKDYEDGPYDGLNQEAPGI